MKELPAIFQDGKQRYAADTCEPLKDAATQGKVQLHAWGRASYPGALLPSDCLPAVRSVGIWDATAQQSWGLDLHCNEGLEFTLLKKGKLGFEVDGRQWLLRKDCLTITRPWQFHRVGSPHIGASRLIWLILDVNVRRPNQLWQWPDWLVCSPVELQKLTRLLSHNEQPVWQADEEIVRWFDLLAALLEGSADLADSESKLKLAINGLLLAVLEMLDHEQIPLNEYLSTTERAVQMFLRALPQHSAFDWNLAAMAQQCGLSRSQFSLYCRQLTNMTPMEYLAHCRVEKASAMLRAQADASVTEVAFACGFNSSQYFATVFRSVKGCSPSEFAAQGNCHAELV